jgi:GNAT superfamily N-acetyltransferase
MKEARGVYTVELIPAGELTKQDLDACVAAIKKGEAVDWQSASRELPLATAVALARLGPEVVGVGAIKRARQRYGVKIARDSGFDLPPETLELGYVAVDPDHRHHGLSQRIVAELLSHCDTRCFATTDNKYMKKTLTNAGFVRKGREWPGRKANLSLWDRERHG